MNTAPALLQVSGSLRPYKLFVCEACKARCAHPTWLRYCAIKIRWLSSLLLFYYYDYDDDDYYYYQYYYYYYDDDEDYSSFIIIVINMIIMMMMMMMIIIISSSSIIITIIKPQEKQNTRNDVVERRNAKWIDPEEGRIQTKAKLYITNLSRNKMNERTNTNTISNDFSMQRCILVWIAWACGSGRSRALNWKTQLWMQCWDCKTYITVGR